MRGPCLPARSPWPQGSCPPRGLRSLLKMGLGGPSVRGRSRLALRLLIPCPPPLPTSSVDGDPRGVPSPALRCHLLLECPREGGTAPSRSLAGAPAEGGGTQQSFPWPADGEGEGESTAKGGCRQLSPSPSVGGSLQSLPHSVTSQIQSVSVFYGQMQGVKAAWQRPCGDYLSGSGANLSLPLPGFVLLGKRRCEMLQDLGGSPNAWEHPIPPGSLSPSRRSYGSRERLDLLYLCAISLGRYKFLPFLPG